MSRDFKKNMKILVSITSYNVDKQKYLSQILKCYENISCELNCTIDIVLSIKYDHEYITTNKLILNKSEYTGESHCWSNRKYIYENYSNYDYVIESDDDVLISKENILQYIKYQHVDINHIPGFIVTEEDCEKNIYIHSMLFNEPVHILRKFLLENKTWFVPRNIHSACFMVDKIRLEKLFNTSTDALSIKSVGVYDTQCTARSEIYTFYIKIINLDEIQHHLVKHLPNKYLYANIFPVEQYRTVNFWKDYIINI
jgi:hypothetical protein